VHAELNALLEAARGRELTVAELRDRLNEIHRRYLGDAADAPDWVERRREAVAAYDDFSQTIERHHAIERLAKALGVDDDPRS